MNTKWKRPFESPPWLRELSSRCRGSHLQSPNVLSSHRLVLHVLHCSCRFSGVVRFGLVRRVSAGLGGLDDPVSHHTGHSAVSGHPTWTCPPPTSPWWRVGFQPTGLHDSEKVCQPLHGPKEVESGTSVVSRSSDKRSGERTAWGPTRAAHKGVAV